MKYIYQINNFNKIKNKLVKLLEEATFTSLENNIEKISKTDFHISKDINRKYVSFLQDEILNNFSIWFQIYKYGDFHALHTHLNTNFTNIIYVSLPNKKIKTNVYSLQRKSKSIDIQEGDILTFPAFLPHESPVNTCKKDKIIVSFNSSGNIIE